MTEERTAYGYREGVDTALGQAALLAGMLARARDDLRQSIDELGQVVTDLVEEMKVRELKALAGQQARELAQAKRDLVTLWQEKVLSAEMLAEREQIFRLAWKDRNGRDVVDPTTGKANVKHTELAMAVAMQNDEELQDRREEAFSAELAYRRRQAEIEGLEAQLSVTRHGMRLTAAELVYLAGPVAALGPLTRLGEKG